MANVGSLNDGATGTTSLESTHWTLATHTGRETFIARTKSALGTQTVGGLVRSFIGDKTSGPLGFIPDVATPLGGRVQTEPNRLESYLPLSLTNKQWTRANLKSPPDQYLSLALVPDATLGTLLLETGSRSRIAGEQPYIPSAYSDYTGTESRPSSPIGYFAPSIHLMACRSFGGMQHLDLRYRTKPQLTVSSQRELPPLCRSSDAAWEIPLAC